MSAAINLKIFPIFMNVIGKKDVCVPIIACFKTRIYKPAFFIQADNRANLWIQKSEDACIILLSYHFQFSHLTK